MGIHDSTYCEAYKYLDGEIIKPAVAEVNKTISIVITLEVRKRGRAVTVIRIVIIPNPQLDILSLDDGVGLRTALVCDLLRPLGVRNRSVRRWTAQHGEYIVASRWIMSRVNPE